MKMTNLFKVFQKVLLDIDQDDEVLSPPCYLCLPSAGAGGRGRGWPWQWCREVDWCSARAPPARSPATRGPPPCNNMPAVNKENISKAVKISATSSHTSPGPRTWSRVRCGCWGRPRSSRPCWPRPRRRRWTCWPGTRTCSCSGVSPCPTVARKPRKIVCRLIANYRILLLLCSPLPCHSWGTCGCPCVCACGAAGCRGAWTACRTRRRSTARPHRSCSAPCSHSLKYFHVFS